MLVLTEQPPHDDAIALPGAMRAIVSWNADVSSGELALIVHCEGGGVSPPLPYVRWSPDERRSLGGADRTTRIAIDVVQSDLPISAIAVGTAGPLDALAISVPSASPPNARRRERTRLLDVQALSQYVPEQPQERGWCSAASLAMVLGYHGVETNVPTVAAKVWDAAYGGTGNWVFNAAYAGACGLRGVVAHLDGIDHVAAFIDAGLPVVISIDWKPGELPGAPLERSEGHLVVVRGLEGAHVAVNDPAQPAIATRYDRDALDGAFRRHGGIAYLVAPRARSAELVALANGADATVSR